MKNLTIKGISVLTLSVFVFAPVVSHAQFTVDTQGRLGAELDGVLDADVRMDANTQAELSDEDISVEGENQSEFEARNNDSKSNSNLNSSTSLRINAAGIAVTSSSQVQSDSDLEIFSSNISKKDEHIAKVDVESDSDDESKFEVVYKHKGKLFGFIPLTLKSTTVVEAKSNSEVEVRAKMPWWAFLVAKADYDKSELEAKIANNPSIKANANANASAQARAEVIEAIVAEVEAHVNASAKAELNR